MELDQEKAKRFAELDKQIKELKAEQDKLKEDFKVMAENNKLSATTTVGSIQFVYSEEYYTFALDEEKLKTEFPQVYDKCIKPTYTAPTIKVQLAKGGKK